MFSGSYLNVVHPDIRVAKLHLVELFPHPFHVLLQPAAISLASWPQLHPGLVVAKGAAEVAH